MLWHNSKLVPFYHCSKQEFFFLFFSSLLLLLNVWLFESVNAYEPIQPIQHKKHFVFQAKGSHNPKAKMYMVFFSNPLATVTYFKANSSLMLECGHSVHVYHVVMVTAHNLNTKKYQRSQAHVSWLPSCFVQPMSCALKRSCLCTCVYISL